MLVLAAYHLVATNNVVYSYSKSDCRIALCEADNQMNATNMGIVFGPTLMWGVEMGAPLNSLLEAPHQGRLVELLIRHAYVRTNLNILSGISSSNIGLRLAGSVKK